MCKALKKGNWTLERDEDRSGPYAFNDQQWIAFDDDTSLRIKVGEPGIIKATTLHRSLSLRPNTLCSEDLVVLDCTALMLMTLTMNVAKELIHC